MTRTLPGSKHFHLAPLAEGVYAAVVIPGTGADDAGVFFGQNLRFLCSGGG